MRTLIFSCIIIFGFSKVGAQAVTSKVSAEALTREDTLKVLKAYQNLVGYILAGHLSNKTIEERVWNLVEMEEVDHNGYPYKIGVVRARRILFAKDIKETGGDINKIGEHGESGPFQVSAIHLQDHYRRNPNYKRYTLQDLAKPENIVVSLDIINSYIAHKPYKITSIERLLRAWNGGPDGWQEVGTKGEDPEHHERELVRTWDYYQKILQYESLISYLEENGIAHLLWTSPAPSITTPPGF